MILSDRTIREELEKGGIVIDPLRDDDIQPSSVDVRVDRYFRVFRNDTTPFIDPKQAQEDLTELVEVEDGKPFILHPGEFVLGSTLERVELGPDLVGRLEGKSSLGRLGLLIHSSLPASERVMVRVDGRLEPRAISDVVEQRLEADVIGFDPETFEVGFHRITGWYQGPPDRIYEVSLGSGRVVRVTAGHNLFTVDREGRLAKTRTLALAPGAMVAIPRSIPDGEESQARRSLPPQLWSNTDARILDRAERAGDAVRLATLRRVRTAYRRRPECSEELARLDRLITGGLLWDRVVEVRDTGSIEPIYDLEVRPGGRRIENFLAGDGGVFVSNTAGFVDAGWEGHLTLELSNVANLPIAIYPGMKIGQLSFVRMTSEADNPYGSKVTDSKYKGQKGPTASRYYLNFRDGE